jgi:hypothetical protein
MKGGILVNTNGKRFVNELGLRSVVSKAIQTQNTVYPNTENKLLFAWCILSKPEIELFGAGQLSFYKDKIGLFYDCPVLFISFSFFLSFCSFFSLMLFYKDKIGLLYDCPVLFLFFSFFFFKNVIL